MNPYSEVEAKFDATNLDHKRFEALTRTAILKTADLRKYKISQYKLAEGSDTFFKLGDGVVRFRRDRTIKVRGYRRDSNDNEWHSLFTVKARRSDKNLLNRKEVDLPLGDRSLADVRAFMDLLGAKKLYSIQKDYTIFMLENYAKGVHVCLAMYDVCRPGGRDPHRFLEVEIERDSTCSAKEGAKALKTWIAAIQKVFDLGEPVNVSLYELYGKGRK